MLKTNSFFPIYISHLILVHWKPWKWIEYIIEFAQIISLMKMLHISDSTQLENYGHKRWYIFLIDFYVKNAGCEARTRDLWIMRPTLCRLLSQPGIWYLLDITKYFFFIFSISCYEEIVISIEIFIAILILGFG